MRLLYPSLCAVLLGAAAALAQAPQPAADPKLDYILGNWEKAMTELSSFKADCARTNLDKTFNARDEFVGKALFLKATAPKQRSRAALQLVNKKRPEIFEKYLCTGTFVYDYKPAAKQIHVYDMEATGGQLGDENFLQFLFGMKSSDAKTRYHITYVPAPATDKWYHYLRVLPKQPQDKADFAEARLVLMADSFLPRQVWYSQPNGNEITWDFPKIERNVQIALTEFDPPSKAPPGWEMRRVDPRATPNVPPTVVRPQNK